MCALGCGPVPVGRAQLRGGAGGGGAGGLHPLHRVLERTHRPLVPGDAGQHTLLPSPPPHQELKCGNDCEII